MDNFDNIKQVWLSADVSALPQATDVLREVRRYRLRHIFKTAGIIALIVLLLIIMCWVLVSYRSTFISTRIGEACFLIALIVLLSIHLKSLRRVSCTDALANSQFLQYLKNEKQSFIRYQQGTQKIGFAIASAGLLLYVFEQVHDNFLTLIVCYTLIIAWCCISWFIIRPIAMKKKTIRFNKAISRLEQFLKQLSHD